MPVPLRLLKNLTNSLVDVIQVHSLKYCFLMSPEFLSIVQTSPNCRNHMFTHLLVPLFEIIPALQSYIANQISLFPPVCVIPQVFQISFNGSYALQAFSLELSPPSHPTFLVKVCCLLFCSPHGQLLLKVTINLGLIIALTF